MNGKKARLLKQNAVKIGTADNKDVKDVYKGLKHMVKSGIIKFGK